MPGAVSQGKGMGVEMVLFSGWTSASQMFRGSTCGLLVVVVVIERALWARFRARRA